jgi:hypothetical protein
MEADMAYTDTTDYSHGGGSCIYFETQAEALRCMEEGVQLRGYTIVYPDRLWSEHVAYGTTVNYAFALTNRRGGTARKMCHCQLYRMDSGRYELNWYIC